MSSGLLVQGVAEEKQTRTIEILLSSISPFTLMAGKVLGLGAAGLFQIILWLFTARILASLLGSVLPLPGPITIEPAMIALGVLFFFLGYLFFATILAAVGAMATTPQEGGQMSAIVIMPGMIPYFLLAIIIDEPNGVVARVLTFIPFTAPITAMLRLSADTIPWMDIGLAVLIMVLSIGEALYLSSRVFRAVLLLYGR